MKKFCATLLVLMIPFAVAGCSGSPTSTPSPTEEPTPQPSPTLTIALVEVAPVEVTFPAGDAAHTTIHGTLYGQNPIGVIFTHDGQLNSDRGDWLPFAEQVAAYGYMVLIYDNRGYGETGGSSGGSGGITASMDGALAFMREQGAEQLILVSSGTAGIYGIKLACENANGDIVGNAAISAARVSFDNTIAVGRTELTTLTMPTLWAVTSEDEVRFEDTQAMYELAGGTDKQLLIYPGMIRGADILRDEESGPDLAQHLLAFILRAAPIGE